ncbi:unnamed protein product [Adineta steineri]|uniref:Uncharacterized protein n=1 Tax=Adineta steineri TaxID=433720 RepID=A0A815UNI5_9BILA|nr:unnamed protein product [Adineta steineri]CAF1520008.1 unnamed protein product [Adineta steineri]
MEYNTVLQPSLPSSSWIRLRNQMKMPIPKSTLLCTTYIRYLSHYRSSTWSNIVTFPPNIQQDQIDHRPILHFNCVSQATASSRPCLSIAQTMSPINASSIIAAEREVCLRFIGAFNILLTPLILEYLTTYIEKWKTYDIHPISILDGLHVQAKIKLYPSVTSIDLSATKISLQLPKINVCLFQAGLAEDNIQLTELRTPVDIVTMSLFAL